MQRKLSLQHQHKYNGLQMLEGKVMRKSGKQIFNNEKVSKLKIDELQLVNESSQNSKE